MRSNSKRQAMLTLEETNVLALKERTRKTKPKWRPRQVTGAMYRCHNPT